MVSRKNITIGLLFVLSYLFLWFFSGFSVFLHGVFQNIPLINVITNVFFPLPQWNLSGFPFVADYMLLLMPFAGFFFIYFLIDWINEFFECKFAFTVLFPVLFFVLSLIAWHIVLIFYFGNISFLNNNVEIPFDSLAYFKNSPFYVFVLSGLLGWSSRKIILILDGRK
jgi:hypothetical protein